MTDKEINKRVFIEYANNFDKKQKQTIEKIEHTIRVSELAEKICKSMGEYKELGYFVGLFHDIGRFSQWEKYGSFDDSKTEDHADKACELLFQNEEISHYKFEKSEYALIFFAVKNHNKYEINKKEIQNFCDGKIVSLFDKPAKIYYNKNIYEVDEIVKYCKILRDADKIDGLLRVSTEKDPSLENLPNGVSEEALDEFMNKKVVHFCNAKTKLDHLLVEASMPFDLNFKQSVKLLNLDSFVQKMKNLYSGELKKKDCAKFEKCLDFMQQVVAQRFSR